MIIYCATNKTNDRKYVGRTVCGLKKRKWGHESKARNGSDFYFHNAIRKYGVDGFTWDVIYRTDNEKELPGMERNFISMFKTTDKKFGYNLMSGDGDGNGTHSDESRKKISEAQSGEKNHNFGKPKSEETRAKMSVAQSGEKNHRYDKTIYNFSHAEHGDFTGVQYELRTKFGLDKGHVSKLVTGKCKSHKGWTMAGNI